MKIVIWVFVTISLIVIILYGSSFPFSQIFGKVVYEGDRQTKNIALTFDDGPSEYTITVLDLLKKEKVKATFFIIGKNVEENEDILKRIHSEGHDIGIHSYTHPVMPFISNKRIDKEIKDTKDLLKQTVDMDVVYFRPPYGIRDWRVIGSARKHGLRTVTWTHIAPDYKVQDSERIAQGVIHSFRNGAIITMHDGGGNRQATVNALPLIIKEAQNQGYQLVSLTELLS
ncbi:MAG: polysaccharide deacetylase family protein [Nanoarchaeota archaeon]|nr:polysaccharide deacetylase family protein [Nanoarchaeota archaeon]